MTKRWDGWDDEIFYKRRNIYFFMFSSRVHGVEFPYNTSNIRRSDRPHLDLIQVREKYLTSFQVFHTSSIIHNWRINEKKNNDDI